MYLVYILIYTFLCFSLGRIRKANAIAKQFSYWTVRNKDSEVRPKLHFSLITQKTIKDRECFWETNRVKFVSLQLSYNIFLAPINTRTNACKFSRSVRYFCSSTKFHENRFNSSPVVTLLQTGGQNNCKRNVGLVHTYSDRIFFQTIIIVFSAYTVR